MASKECSTCKKTGEDVLSCVCKTVHYCNKKCQKDDWKVHKEKCPPYVVGDCGAKGRGMFATRNIARASVILIENPVLTLSSDMNDNLKTEKLIGDFLELPESTRKEILNLKADRDCPDTFQKLERIFMTNKVKTGNPGCFKQESLHIKHSFINHSCNPNCCYVPEETSYVTIKSLVDIKKGEELTISYRFDPYKRVVNCLTRDERRAALWFECVCSICLENDQEDEKLRKEYQSLDMQLGEHIIETSDFCKDTDRKTAKLLLRLAERKLEIGRKVNNQVLWRDLMDCLATCYHCFLNHKYRNDEMFAKCKELRAEVVKMSSCFNSQKCPENIDKEVGFFQAV